MNTGKRFGRNSKGQIWLNVASSSYVLEDFINLENHLFLRLAPFAPFLRSFLNENRKKQINDFIEAKSKVTLIFYNCLKPLPFPDGSVDHILCSHFLEHVYSEEARILVQNYHKILKPGGTLHVIVPDLAARAKEYIGNLGKQETADRFLNSTILSSQKRPKFSVRLREFMGGFGHNHHWMYDNASMVYMLKEASFEICENNDSPSKAWREEDNDNQINMLARKI